MFAFSSLLIQCFEMKKYFLTLMTLIYGGFSTYAQQDTLVEIPMWGYYKRAHVSIGYNLGLKDTIVDKNLHLLEVKFDRLNFETRHGHSMNWYAGSEIGINTGDFLVGPKIGGAMSYGPIALGVELIYYTDFSVGSLHLIPTIGLEYHRLKLSMNPHARLTNKDFNPVNIFNFNFTYRLFTLKEEEWN